MTRGTERLLARGGRPLGIAAAALACGQRPGKGPWHALAPDLVAASEEVLAALSVERDPAVLSAALAAALGPRPANAPPSWFAALDEAALARIGASLSDVRLPPGIAGEALPLAARALWALALAFCRNPDTAAAAAALLDPQELGARLLDWSRLAQVLARPGEPSRMRRRLKALLAGKEAADG